MVLVKIRHQRQEGIHTEEILGSNVDVLGQEDTTQDFDNFELANAGCELGMVEDQLCSIPYELYDLPDLKEILSIETWNSCLTEEERFSLSAFLPDMDQETFWLTMKELLGGKDMFFCSPLMVFFQRMKGGFYPPNVTRFREGLQFLQKMKFYHSLRLYHENMAQTFSDMKKTWSKCQSSIGVEERVRIWSNWKNCRAKNGVDLNSIPEDEDLLIKSTIRSYMNPVPNRVKFPPVLALAPLKTNGKGVLKIKPKPAAMHPIQTEMVCRPTPKGVLKVVQKGPLNQMHERRTLPGQQESPALAGNLEFQMSRLSTLPQRMYGQDKETHSKESPFLHQPDRSGKTYKILEPPISIISRQRVEHLSTTGTDAKFHSSVRKKKHAKDPTFSVGMTNEQEVDLFPKNSLSVKKYSRRSSQIAENLNGEDLWQNMGQRNTQYFHDSREQQMVPKHDNRTLLYPRTSDTVLRISSVGITQQKMLPTPMDQREVFRDVDGRGSQQLFDEPAVSKGQRDGPTLPITYKRRKALSKANTLDAISSRTAEVKLESRAP